MKSGFFAAFGAGAALILLFPLLSPSNPQAQAQKEQSSLQYEVKVTVKLVQVYVTDKKGNPVLDLGKEDFIVYDNGEKKSLTEFEKHVLVLPSAKGELEPPRLIETPAEPARELMPRKFFLFFDFAYNNAIGIQKAKDAALHFIDTQVQPTDEVGLLSYSALRSLVLHEYLTTDHSKIRKIVKGFGMRNIVGRAEDFEARYWQLLTDLNPRDASHSGYITKFVKKAGEDSPPSTDAGALGGKTEQELELAWIAQQRKETELQSYNFTRKMNELAKALKYIPGQKNIVLFSSGVPYSVLTDISPPNVIQSFGQSLLSQRYEDMLKELSSANCAVFAMDTQDWAHSIDRDLRTRGTFSLQKMTSATGGKYFGNINKYEDHVEAIQALTGCYYVIGYYADDRWDGAYHKIKVEVERPGCRVHAQKGYFNPKPFAEYSDLEKTLHLVDLALSEEPLFQTPERLSSAAVSFSPDREANLFLVSRIDTDKLQEVTKGKFEIISLIFNREGNIIELRREENKAGDIPGGDFYYYSFFSLPPGAYTCRLVLRNLETGLGAVASSLAIVEKKPERRIQICPPLFLSSEKDALYLKGPSSRKASEEAKALSAADVFHFDTSQYSPCLEEFFGANSLVPAILQCTTAGIAAPKITLSASLVERSSGNPTPLTLFILSEERETDLVRFFVNIPIPELRAGLYDLRLAAGERASKSTSEITKTLRIQ
jgi:VWFA-related protein